MKSLTLEERKLISYCCEKPNDCKWGGIGGCGYEGKKYLLESAMKQLTGELRLPNGCTLYWKSNEAGGRTYFSDEIGGGVIVWDTCLVDQSTLLAAMTLEADLGYKEYLEKKCGTSTKNENEKNPGN